MSTRPTLASLALTLGSALGCSTVGAVEDALPRAETASERVLLRAERDMGASEGSLLDRMLGIASSLGRNSQRPVRSSANSRDMQALGLSPSQPGLAVLCASGDAGMLGFSEQCMLARLEIDSASLPGYGSGVGVSGAWFIERAGIDVNYGLSWLSVQAPQQSGARSARWNALPGLSEVTPLHLALPLAETDARMLQLGAEMGLGSDGWLRIDAQNLRSQGRTVDLWGTSVPVYESDALRLSGGSGAFSSSLTARLLEFRGLPGVLNSLDLGISWRTPWRGELTVGATQYWTRGNTSAWPMRELPPAEEASGRVPYVRYQQDL